MHSSISIGINTRLGFFREAGVNISKILFLCSYVVPTRYEHKFNLILSRRMLHQIYFTAANKI